VLDDRFTDRVRKVMALARQQAARCEHAWIGSVHVMLALLEDAGGLAGQAMRDRGLELELAGQAVRALTPPEGPVEPGELPRTEDARALLERAAAVVDEPGGPIDTEHLLLGLLADADCAASQVLLALGADPKALEQAVYDRIAAGPTDAPGLRPTGPLDADDVAAVGRAALRSLEGAADLLGLLARENPGLGDAAHHAQLARDELERQLPPA